LSHPDGDVRGGAAFELAFHLKDWDSLPPILLALKAETSLRVRVDLATAAAELGSKPALEALQFMCMDSGSPSLVRATAAEALIGLLGCQECIGTLVEVLQLHDNVKRR